MQTVTDRSTSLYSVTTNRMRGSLVWPPRLQPSREHAVSYNRINLILGDYQQDEMFFWYYHLVCNRQNTMQPITVRSTSLYSVITNRMIFTFSAFNTSSTTVKTPYRQSPLDQPQVKKFFIPSKENVGATRKERRQCTQLCKRLTFKKHASNT